VREVGGRFLSYSNINENYVDIGDEEAMERTSQALEMPGETRLCLLAFLLHMLTAQMKRYKSRTRSILSQAQESYSNDL